MCRQLDGGRGDERVAIEPPRSEKAPRRITVLVVDDSAVVRQVFKAMLEQAGMAVVTAHDPVIAMDKMRQGMPDVVILDLELPRMDGITFLRKLMSETPVPVIICSGLAEPGTDEALQSLEEGALEVIAKPRLGVRSFLQEAAERLVEAVQAAAQARVRRRVPMRAEKHTADVVLPRRRALAPAGDRGTLVAIGASTGGTEAIRDLLQMLPPDAPPVVVVQHMPEFFTAAFARRLSKTCAIEVVEATHEAPLVPGRALIAPGNRHLVVQRRGGHYYAEVIEGPLVSRHRPSVDVLFRSVAQAAGSAAVGVLLTGMGDDGAEGLLELKQAGAHTIAQDEATSVVFGMPKEAIARGAAGEVLPLPDIAAAVMKKVGAG
jgi:two-component system chemotaxis response regulator CheB